ncbi:MAG: hypothetical protein J5819_07615 [Eubacterium sp.]|nr:hypothetical protein [Eubacterium sp.]
MARERRKERKLKKRLINRKPADRYKWLLTLMNGTDCILRVEDKYNIYRRLEDEFAELSELDETEADGFTEMEKCAELSEECARIADSLEPELPEDAEEYSRTEMMTAGRRQEEIRESEGKHSVFRIVLLSVLLLVIGWLVCRKIPVTRAMLGSIEEFAGFNSFAIKSYRVAGNESDGWRKAANLEKKVLHTSEIGAKVKFGKTEWIVLKHKNGGTLLIADEPIKYRPFHNAEGDVSWSNCHLREYLNGKYLKNYFYPCETDIIMETDVTDSIDPNSADDSPVLRDKVYIPSGEDIFDYEDTLGSKINNLRLRDKGENAGTTTFVSAEGDIIDYGFPSDMNGCYIRPMIWVMAPTE